MLKKWRDSAREVISKARRREIWKARDFSAMLEEETLTVDRLTADPARGPEHLETIQARGERAVTLRLLEHTEEALAEFTWVEERLARHPEIGLDHEEVIEARWQRGVCMLGLDRPAEALAIFADLDDRGSDDPRFGAKRKIANNARRMRRKLLEIRLRERLLQCDEAAERGQREVALAALDEILEEDPMDRTPAEARPSDDLERLLLATLQRRAVLLEGMLRQHEALEDRNRLVTGLAAHSEIGPRHLATAAALRDRAVTLTRLGKYREALVDCRQVATALADADGADSFASALDARLILGYALVRLGRHAAALREVDAVLGAERDPLADPAWDLWDFGRSLRGGLLRLIPFAISERILNAANAYEEGRFEHAAEDWERIVELATLHPELGRAHPDTATASRNLVAALLAAGRREEALERWRAIRAALEGQEPEPPTTVSLAFTTSIPSSENVQQRLGELEDALRRFQADPPPR